MTCPHGSADAAYVLGALGARERLDFERHLAGCAECTQAVGDLAGLPGLLGRLDPGVVESTDDPVPDTLLPALTREVQRRTRAARWRRTVLPAVAAAALAVLVTTTVATLLGDDGAGPVADPPATSASTSDPAAAPARMTPVGQVPVRATVTLEDVTWGTRLGLDCTYDTASVEYSLPPEVDYLLYVRTRDGRTERVGSWRSVDGQTMRLSAGTAASRDEIASVEVRAPDGRVVLLLGT